MGRQISGGVFVVICEHQCIWKLYVYVRALMKRCARYVYSARVCVQCIGHVYILKSSLVGRQISGDVRGARVEFRELQRG